MNQENLLALPGDYQLNHYIIDHVLGQGGFGIVYKAHHIHLDEKVVIKEFLPAELAGRKDITVTPHTDKSKQLFEDCRQRFIEEGKVLRKLNHRNVVRCHDLFEANGTAYLVMEFEDGLPFDELLNSLERQGGKYSEEQLLQVLTPLAEGLMYVHDVGVLHRDIKPGNVFIRRSDNSPVLLDFGAAKQNFAEVSQSQAPFTEFYAPIDQLDTSRKPSIAIDIHAFGGMMYRAVTGQIGPKAESRSTGITIEGEDPLIPSVKLAAGEYSKEFLILIDQCLAFRPKDRPESMEVVSAILRNLQSDQVESQDELSEEAFPKNNITKEDNFQSQNAPISSNKEASAVKNLNKSVDDTEKNSSQVSKKKGASNIKSIVLFSLVIITVSIGIWRQYYLEPKVKDQNVIGNTNHKDYEKLGKAAYDNEDYETSFRYFQRAADDGNAEAMTYLGYFYFEGKGIKQDYSEALYWFKKAVDKNHAGAMYYLGQFYFNGIGEIKRDDSIGLKWTRISAEKDFRLATFQLGMFYLEGHLVNKNYSEARKWLLKAALKEHSGAMFELGLMYETGKGVLKDIAEAVKWYKKAVDKKHSEANERLKVLSENLTEIHVEVKQETNVDITEATQFEFLDSNMEFYQGILLPEGNYRLRLTAPGYDTDIVHLRVSKDTRDLEVETVLIPLASLDELMKIGKNIYITKCAACHGPNGESSISVFPSLKNNKILKQDNIDKVISIVSDGVPGTSMMSFQSSLTRLEIASVITYVSNSWGNKNIVQEGYVLELQEEKKQ